MINMIDRILELGERLKADVRASNNANSQIFLRLQEEARAQLHTNVNNPQR